MDSKKRSWMKSITWRIVGIIVLGIISYFATSNIKEMTQITLVFNGIRLNLYYYHERIWNRIEYGRIASTNEDWTI
jgi:uncharacterized membrane protein